MKRWTTEGLGSHPGGLETAADPADGGLAEEQLGWGAPGAGAPGILIADGGVGSLADRRHPRVVAFVYGEAMPASPTLPFGRWKRAS